MSLVGSVLLGAREIFTDLPQLLPNPSGSLVPAAAAVASANPLPAATYFLVFTIFNQWGQTLQSNEISVVVGGGQAIQLTGTFSGVSMRAYFATATGAENSYVSFTSLPFTIDSTVAVTVEAPPARNTAYLPDSDGQLLSASALYRWFNDGLKAGSTICGGIPDFGAVATASGQPVYSMIGTWKKIDNAWYDGYPLYLGNKTDVFRRNKVTGTVGTLTVNQVSDRLIVECWPQPARTSGATTTNAVMTAGSTSVALVTSNFTLGFGLALIGSEVVEFASNSGGVLSGLTRGMGGTVAQAWPSGTPVRELNLMISGYRVPSDFSVGQAASVFTLAPGWEEAMITYLEARLLKAEKQYGESEKMMKEFTAKVMNLKANRIVAGPRQIKANAGRGAEVYPGLGGPFGGVIVQ